MTELGLARAQFAITSVYHFFFVPLTLGLSILVFLMEVLYVRSGDERYKRMTQFWGKLFVINFAMGVVTGIVQEFQFGLNWAGYSRFVGDIFGVPLAIEALLAFFLESTFLGIWIFGWDKLPKALHAAAIGLVALGGNLSALWILIANSFMQEPAGYVLRNGRAEMTDFGALVGNTHVWMQFPHVLFAGMCTAGFFVLGISAYHLVRKSGDHEVFRRSFAMAAVYGLIGAALVGMVGHAQSQHMFKTQPMKMAAAEALWETENPAALSILTISNEAERREVLAFKIPALMSLLVYNRLEGEVKGINPLQAEYEQQYGPGVYVPPVTVCYWSFRFMFGSGLLMVGVGLLAVYLVLRRSWKSRREYPRWLRWVPLAIALPYLANTGGWLLTELGRQPWIVFGVLKTADAISPSVSTGEVFASVVIFTLLYGVLMAADVYLLAKFARAKDAGKEAGHGQSTAAAETKGEVGWI